MTKHDKYIGVVKKKHRVDPEKATPKAKPKVSWAKRPFGIKTVYHLGTRYASVYRTWFETEKQRDQAFRAAKKYDFLTHEKIKK